MPEKTYSPSAKSEKALKLKPGSGYSIVPDLPPSLAMRRSELLKERSEMPESIHKKFKLVYLKEIPFVDLVERKSGRR